PDAAAFDRALSGGIRTALTKGLSSADPVGTAFRQTRVGNKLESQWELFAKDLPLSWSTIAALQPSAVGVSLLSVADLEAVLAIRTALAQLPLALPAGSEKPYRGVPLHVVASGAGDERTAQRRMGLAWTRVSGVLLIATSEKSLKLSVDRSLASEGFTAFLPGLVSMKLDLASLRKDPYFKREFLFDEGMAGPDKGSILTALTQEGRDWVEVRQGEGDARPAAGRWTVTGRDIVAAGWESDGSRFFPALRRGFLEPVPEPASHPVAARRAIPDPAATGVDRYVVDITRPESETTGKPGDGELPRWAETFTRVPVTGWGWEVSRGGARRLVLRRPASADAAFAELAQLTTARRAGFVTVSDRSGARELRVGPDLPTVAWKRKGEWLWIGAREADLADVPEPSSTEALVRWSQLDLASVRAMKKTWSAAEGAFSPDRARPFSDRILGLLGWCPDTTDVSVERHRNGDRWTERLVFSGRAVEPARKTR
ncbi:MAG: hypothetical protein ABIT01_05805, partial [Thermoanaerobaculia bacterium]